MLAYADLIGTPYMSPFLGFSRHVFVSSPYLCLKGKPTNPVIGTSPLQTPSFSERLLYLGET